MVSLSHFTYANAYLCQRGSLPSQNVSFPLHCLSAWHRLIADPCSIKPSSQEKNISLGNVVRLPDKVPFFGTDKDPQSFAKRLKKKGLI